MEGAVPLLADAGLECCGRDRKWEEKQFKTIKRWEAWYWT
jgi:hypothetical protein